MEGENGGGVGGDEDDDYMSDKFLPVCDDIRPGLVFKPTIKRQYEQETKQKDTNSRNRTKKLKEIEQEHREEGLQTKLGTGNKGFDLLQKMGYKPGTSLGKSGTDGRLEPIPITIKSDRSGLGRDELLRMKRTEVKGMKEAIQARKQKRLAERSKEFVDYQRAKAIEKQIERDLYSSQKSCQQLDQTMDLVEPAEPWFWPKAIVVSKDEEDEEDSEEEEEEENENDRLEPGEQLEILTSYLRSTHFFCVWCGTTYEDGNDLKENCPGNTSDDH